jgi:hypothetical protein
MTRKLVFASAMLLFAAACSAAVPATVPAPPPPQALTEFASNGGGDDHQLVAMSRARYVLLGIDCFGPLGEATCQELEGLSGLEVGKSIPLGWNGGGAASRMRHKGGWDHVSLSPVFYPDGSAWLAIDVRNGPSLTRSAPTGRVTLRSNLIQVYTVFHGTYLELSQRGIRVPREANDGTWNYVHRTLSPYVALFHSEVPQYRKTLTRMLLTDGRATHRRAAAGLLGFDLEHPDTVSALSTALLDPDQTVRTGAATALLPKVREATLRGELVLEVGDVVQMLMLPSHSDRAGATALLLEMSRLPHARRDIRTEAGPILQQMAAGSHPGTRDLAQKLLATR